jgi:HK97 family phage major capsid protein
MDTAYAAGSFAGTIINANKLDVLRTAIAQVVSNEFIPNYILMHPNDVASLDLEKNTEGDYGVPPFRSANGMVVSGVQVIENTGQTVDKFTVGDFTKFNVRLREGITIDVGLDGNDFTNNLVTILGEIRLASYIKSNHAGAFVSGDFSDAIAALDSGS